MPFEMNFSDKFKEIMGMVEQNAQQLKKDLTWKPLPSGPEVWEAGRQNGKEIEKDILKKRGAEMATDLLPAGGAVGMMKKVADHVPTIRELALKTQKEAGWNHDWPFIPADLGNADFRKLIAEDVGITAKEKEQIFSAGEKLGVVPKRQVNEFFGMHKSTALGDIVLTRSAKDPSKFQMTFFEGKLGSSNTVRDIQFNTKEEAVKAFDEMHMGGGVIIEDNLPSEGLVRKGNIDIDKRVKVSNPDGSFSTVESMSFNEGGVEVLIPTLSPEGKKLSEKEAIALYKKTGQHLGMFASGELADKYARALSKRQGKFYNKE